MGMSGGASRRTQSKNYMGPVVEQNNKANEDLINFLEHKLEEIEKKLSRTQHDYENLQNDYTDLQKKMNISREKYKRAALLMTEFLDDLLNSTPNILDSDKDMHLNLEKIKSTPIEQLDKEDKVALVLVLLKQLQPYLSSQNLSTAPQHHQQPVMTHEQFVSNKADQILMQGAASQSHEVDALNSILNNINVQTKNNNQFGGNGMQPPSGGRLPPI